MEVSVSRILFYGSAGERAKSIFYSTVCRKGSHPHSKPEENGMCAGDKDVTLSDGSGVA
jgi:hypothetical protein